MGGKDRHFMVDDDILEEIVDYAQLTEGDSVLEVGAGSGNLTEKIAQQASVTAIEKDHELYPALKKRFAGTDRVEAVLGDALKVEYPLYNKIVSNLPYSISRKITERFIIEGFELAVLVVQAEFAQKLTAEPGREDYRMISVLVQSTCELEAVGEIAPQAFRPQPKVESAIIRLRQHFKPPKDYLSFLNRLFSRKNKKLRNIFEEPPEGTHHLRPGEMSPSQIRDLYSRF